MSLLAAVAWAQERPPERPPERPVVLRGGTVLPVAGAPIPNGTVVLRGGRIAAVGANVPIPADAEVVNTAGKYVLPGLVDPHSHLGDYSLPGVPAHSDGNEVTGNIQAQIRAEDAINFDDPAIARAVSGGVTTVQVLPGSANNIGGWSAVIKLNGGADLGAIKFPGAPAGMKWAWGENPKNAYGRRDQPPATLMGEAAMIRQRLHDARNYVAKWKAWEEGDKKSAPPARDLQLEALADVLAGKVRLNIHSYQVNHFEALFRIADEFGFTIAALHHALEAYMIAPEIVKRKIGVVTFADSWGFKVEAWNAIPQNAYLLWKQGALVSLHTDSPVIEQRWLMRQASIIAHHGMPEDAALATVTLNPAKILGIDQWVGSIETGKHADVAVWSGPPLEFGSKAERVYIDGKLVYTDRDGYLPWKGRPVGLLPIPGASR